FSSRRRHTRWPRDWSSDVCSSDLISPDRNKNMAANVELLNRVMDRIDNAPEGEWDQSSWCSCFAGQTAKELGYSTEWQFDELGQIGRASCRERGEMTGGDGGVERN